MERPSPVPPNRRVVDGVGLRERPKQPGPLLGVEPDAGVAHGERHARASAAERHGPGVHPDAAALGELERVAEQIEQDLAHARRIADQHVVGTGIDLGIEREPLGGGLRLERAHDAVDQAGQRERGGLQLEAPGLDLREVEHVVDDAQQRLRRRSRMVATLRRWC